MAETTHEHGAPEDHAEKTLFAALLTPQGKFFSDFFVWADGPEDLLLDVAQSGVNAC